MGGFEVHHFVVTLYGSERVCQCPSEVALSSLHGDNPSLRLLCWQFDIFIVAFIMVLNMIRSLPVLFLCCCYEILAVVSLLLLLWLLCLLQNKCTEVAVVVVLVRSRRSYSSSGSSRRRSSSSSSISSSSSSSSSCSCSCSSRRRRSRSRSHSCCCRMKRGWPCRSDHLPLIPHSSSTCS